jgi:hypothetical protein
MLTGEQVMLTDLAEVDKVFAGEKIYCEQCGEGFALWPPDDFYEHTFGVHPSSMWPAVLAMWQNYKSDTDIARRTNFYEQQRVSFLYTTLTRRADLYAKLWAAGVICKPAQG